MLTSCYSCHDIVWLGVGRVQLILVFISRKFSQFGPLYCLLILSVSLLLAIIICVLVVNCSGILMLLSNGHSFG